MFTKLHVNKPTDCLLTRWDQIRDVWVMSLLEIKKHLRTVMKSDLYFYFIIIIFCSTPVPVAHRLVEGMPERDVRASASNSYRLDKITGRRRKMIPKPKYTEWLGKKRVEVCNAPHHSLDLHPRKCCRGTLREPCFQKLYK